MGIVVSATHLQLREPVALKFLRREVMDSEQVVARFAHEARAAAKLKSEHVARVLDVGKTDDGVPFMVMEHLQGSDLGQVIEQEGRLAISTAVEYVIQACEGLAEAHARGIVHRDIKPENLFLVERGGWQCVKILDFGISKAALTAAATPEEIVQLETSAIMGSPCYMSPEQLRSQEVDHRADIWSLGGVLFELIAGTTPFDATQVLSDLITDILEKDPRSLTVHRADTPAGLEQVVATCLQKDRDKRYQTAAELAVALLPYAPRRARVPAERAVTVTRNAGLADASLNLPPSAFPSSQPGVPSIPSASLAPPRVPAFDAERLSRSSAPTITSVAEETGPMKAPAPPKRRKVAAPLLGMGMAILVVGGLLGARVAMHPAAAPVVADTANAPAAAPPPAAAPTAVASAQATAAAVHEVATTPVDVRVETTPPGAIVREDGVQVCATTPCTVAYKGAAAEPSTEHTLQVQKAGFRPETRVVHATDGAVAIKLVKGGAPAASGAKAPAAKTNAGEPPPTVQGFKDIPY